MMKISNHIKTVVLLTAINLIVIHAATAGMNLFSSNQLEENLHKAKGNEKLEMLNALARHQQFTDANKYVNYGKKYLKASKEAGSEKHIFEAHIKLAKAYFNTHQLKKSEHHADKAFDLSIKHDHDLWYAKALMLQVNYSLNKLKLEDASIQLDAIERIYDASNRHEEIREVLLFRAYISEFKNRISEAKRCIRNAYSIARNYGDSLSFIKVKTYEADFYNRRGDFIKALTLYNELSSFEIKHELDYLHAKTLVGMAVVYISLDECDRAREYLQEAYLLSLSSGNIMARALTLKYRGNCLVKEGNFSDGESQYLKALDLFKSIDEKLQAGRVINNLGVIALARNQFTMARRYFDEALEIYEERPFLYSKAITLRNKGRLNLKQGNISKGLEFFNQSNQIASEGNYKEVLILNYQSLADYHESRNNYRKAYAYLNKKESLENINLNDIYMKLSNMQEKMEKDKTLLQYKLKNADYKYQKLQEKNRQKMLWFAGSILMFIIIASLVLYIIWRKKFRKQTGIFTQRNPDVAHDDIDIQKARYTFNAIGDGVVWVNKQGNIVYFNKIAASYAKKTQPNKIEDLLPDITEQQWQKRWAKLYYEHPYISEEHQIQSDEGSLDIEVSMNMLSHDNSVFVAIILKDVSFRKQQEKELYKAIEKAKESDRFKTRLINNISHELRTPLNAINGFIAELNEENSAEEQQKYIENISQSSERLSHLMNEIITLSRIEAENLKVDIKPVNLHKLLNKVIQQYRNKIKHSNKQIDILDDFAFDDRDVVVSADEKHYEEVLRQLMGNAVKYTEKGEIRIGYHFVEDDIVEVFVQDTGMGINKEFQSQVFELFSQADNSDTRKHKGAGLGLSISQKLMMLMRGALTFESEEGIGSIFKTTLKGHTAKQEQKIQNTNQHFDIRLLVITDSATTGTYLKAVLKKTASSIVIYDSLKEGLKALSYHQPDLVLISQSIIQYGDKQICISIRKALPETKIMLLHEDMKYDRQQFDGVIEPNFTQKEINNIISRALQ